MTVTIDNYTFDYSAKTITFNDLSSPKIGRLLAIINQTTGTTIYHPLDSTKSGTFSGNVLTLSYAGAVGTANTNKLTIRYDAETNDPTNSAAQPVNQGDLSDDLDKVAMRPMVLEIQGSAVSATATDVIPATDVSKYLQIGLQVVGTFVGTVRVEGSNDGTNWLPVWGQVQNQGSVTNSLSGPAIMKIDVTFKWFRARTTGTWTSGSVQGFAIARSVTAPNWATLLGTSTTTTIGRVIAAQPTKSTFLTNQTVTTSSNTGNIDTSLYREGIIFLKTANVTGTTPSVTVRLQTSSDGGTTWFDLPNGAFAAVTGTDQKVMQIEKFGDLLRAAWNMTGTTPSFDMEIKAVFK